MDKSVTSHEECQQQLYNISFDNIFSTIKDYHEKLGYPPSTNKLQTHRDLCLALQMEVSELTDAVPWKPWRPDNYKPIDRDNLVEEAIDILFFLSSVMEVWNVTPLEMSEAFQKKLEENYNRIQTGYNRQMNIIKD